MYNTVFLLMFIRVLVFFQPLVSARHDADLTRQMKREKGDHQLELALSNLGWNEQMFLFAGKCVIDIW